MKLSDIKGEAVLDVIADVTAPLSAIIGDEDISKLFRNRDKQNPAQLVSELVPALIRTHKQDVIQVLAALNLQSVKDYQDSLTLSKLLADVYEVLTDEELLSFLAR